MIAFLLWAIVLILFWPIALLIGLGWLALIALRLCLGVTVFSLKALTAAGFMGWIATTKMSRVTNAKGWRYLDRIVMGKPAFRLEQRYDG